MIEPGADHAYVVQITSGAQWVLRLVVLAAGAGALVAINCWAPFLLAPYCTAACGLVALWQVVRPESLAGGVFVAVVVLWWLWAGASAPLWQAGVVAVLLAVQHLGLAYAAAAPPWAGADRATALQWLRGLGIYLVACLVAGALVGLVVAMPLPRAALWVWLGAVGVLALVALVRRAGER